MFCEHPTCSLEANTICKYHCHLSLCEQHRFEHENNLLIAFENQLEDLSNPVSTLVNQLQYDLKQSEESHQRELSHIKSLFDHHLSSVDQRLKLTKKVNELILNKREQLLKCKIGDNQLTKEDYQQIQDFLNEIQLNLNEQFQLNKQIQNKTTKIDFWPIDNQKTNLSSEEIECIELSDSDDESPQNPTNILHIDQCEEINDISSSSNENEISSIELKKKSKSNLALLRDYCPLTKFGIFGLNSSHNLPRLCSKNTNKRRYLYVHFARTHRIKSSIAYQLVRAIRNGSDPMQTKIFPQDNTSIFIENIQCPFDNTFVKFNIPNAPCCSSLVYHYFKDHLRNVHSITKVNTDLIYNAMKEYGTINHLQFEEGLCEIR